MKDVLLARADRIIEMATELKDRGHTAEAAYFALIAAHYLRAVRLLSKTETPAIAC